MFISQAVRFLNDMDRRAFVMPYLILCWGGDIHATILRRSCPHRQYLYATGMNGDETSRITNLNLFPQRIKENVLFSLSFNSHIHYSTLGQPLDPFALTLPKAHRSASPWCRNQCELRTN